MSSIIGTDKVEVHTTDNSISVILNEDFLFNEVSFKVLQNRENNGLTGLIKCGKLSQNGKIKLVYESSRYKSLSVALHQLNSKEFLSVVSNIHDLLMRVQENGFVKTENILFDINEIFVDMHDFSVHMICIPLAVDSYFENKDVAKMELKRVLGDAKKMFSDITVTQINQIIDTGKVPGTITEDPSPTPPPPSPPVPPPPIPPQPVKNNSAIKGLLIFFMVVQAILIFTGMFIMAKGYTLIGAADVVVVACLFGVTLYGILSIDKGSKKSFSAGTLTLVSLNLEPKVKFHVNKSEFVLGRQEGVADGVILNHRTVGRRHCLITQARGQYYIQDLNSVNGTFVNNRRLMGNHKTKINKGDLIRLSRVEFVVK